MNSVGTGYCVYCDVRTHFRRVRKNVFRNATITVTDVTWIVTRMGGGGTKSTLDIRNFNLRKNQVRKRGKLVWFIVLGKILAGHLPTLPPLRL
jgi:hypothetical protein